MSARLSIGQWTLYTGITVMLIAVVCLALLFVYYRPTVEFAFVDIRANPFSRWWAAGLLCVCAAIVAAGIGRAVRRKRGGRDG